MMSVKMLTFGETVAGKAGRVWVDGEEDREEVCQVEAGMQHGGVAAQVVVDAAQVEVVREGVHVDQVLVLLTLVHKQQLHLEPIVE